MANEASLQQVLSRFLPEPGQLDGQRQRVRSVMTGTGTLRAATTCFRCGHCPDVTVA